jgi:hypothetical protein
MITTSYAFLGVGLRSARGHGRLALTACRAREKNE